MRTNLFVFFDTYQDRHTAASYMYLAMNRWFALRLDGISVILVASLAFASVLLKHCKGHFLQLNIKIKVIHKCALDSVKVYCNV